MTTKREYSLHNTCQTSVKRFHKRIPGNKVITGLIIIFLTTMRYGSDGLLFASNAQNDSVRAPVIVRAGPAVVNHLEDLPVPERNDISQFRPPRQHPAGFIVPMQKFNTEDGLALSSILCGIKDHNGFLWFGTSGNGVSRYDGQRFTNFSSSNGLIHNLISCISEDREGNIWFGTYGGLSVYDGRSFVNYTVEQGLPDNDINEILEDREGNLWIGTVKGLSLIKASERKSVPVNFINYTEQDGSPGINVRDILEDRNGRLWFANENGVSRYDPDSNIFIDIFRDAGIEKQMVISMAEDHEGILWFGTTSGVIQFDPEAHESPLHYTTKDGLVNNDIRCINVDRTGKVWIGTSKGVSAFIKKENAFFNITQAEGLSHDIICSITEDEAGSLWFGTLGEGLCRYDGTSIMGYSKEQGLPGTVLYAVSEDKEGNLWFAGNDAGLIKMTYSQEETRASSFINYTSRQGLPDDYNLALMTDQNSNLWIGSPSGLHKFVNGSFFSYTTQQGLVNDYVVCLSEDQQGNIWIGTYEGGVSKFDGKSFTNYTTDQGLVHNTVWDIMEDQKGMLWFVTRGGLSIFNGDYFINFTTDQGLADNKLSSILKDHSGNILIGTWGGGISVIRKHKVEQLSHPENIQAGRSIFDNYTTSHGLSNNVVYKILEDSRGNIFIGSNEGITVLKNGLSSSGEKLSGSEPRNFNQKAGYPIKDISNNNSMFIDSRDVIWAGTGDKLVRFDYERVLQNQNAPHVFIRQIKVDNEIIPWISLNSARKGYIEPQGYSNFVPAYKNNEQMIYGKILNENERDTLVRKYSNIHFDDIKSFYGIPENLSLPYVYNNIDFDFVGVETQLPLLVRYQYKLEGFDEQWTRPTTTTSAKYGNLPPGEYAFAVRAQSSDGVWSEPTVYEFQILPPWFRTWPAYLFYGLLFIFGVYLIDRFQRRRLITRERQRTMKRELEQAREIEKSYLELKVAQDQLVQSEKMALLGELAAGIAHEIQNPLNFVNNFSEVSIELVQEIKEEINKGNLEEVKEITVNLIQNLSIIDQHGKRASNIVKGMLEHSRTSKGEKRPIDINDLADEFLRLSYHGLRVKDKSFNANFKMEADINLPKLNVVPQDIGRVLLNLFNNAFFAVHEKSKQYPDAFKPEVVVSTIQIDGRVEIKVSDNGIGIPEELKDKIFQPFFTTKPSGMGTGLGLSLSFDIIKAHGGDLRFISKPPEGTSFIIHLPLHQK